MPPIFLALPDLAPSLAAEINPYGLTVHRLIVQADGRTHDLVIGPELRSDLPSPHHKFHNTVVGRYSNRIPIGTHKLERNGITAELHAALNEGTHVNLHGGPHGFDEIIWGSVDVSDAVLFSDAEKNSIKDIPAYHIFTLTSPDGDQGFPGKLLVEVLFGLLRPHDQKISSPSDEYQLGTVFIVYRAKLLSPNSVTPVNLTQHWGFNLGASLKDENHPLSVKDHILDIKASNTIDLDDNHLSTNHLNVTSKSPYDHKSKPIGEGFPEKGYDEFYVFDRVSKTPSRIPLSQLPELNLVGDIVQHANNPTNPPLVELDSPQSGLRILFDSNQSGVQFYSANFVTREGARKKIHGGSGSLRDGYGPQSAAFLEFHEPLAAWLNPATSPSGNDTLITADELYHNFVKATITYRSPHPGE